MAKPIEPTPTLEGEDAKRLLHEIENATFSKSKEIFLDKCTKAYNSTKK